MNTIRNSSQRRPPYEPTVLAAKDIGTDLSMKTSELQAEILLSRSVFQVDDIVINQLFHRSDSHQ